MSKQDLNRYQSKVIKRYYENLDTIVATKLQELVSDLYLADTEKKQASLWKRVKQQLEKTPADPGQVTAVVEGRDPAALATLVNKLLTADKGVLRPRAGGK